MGDTGKRHTAEQIVNKLREAEVELSKGQTIPMVAKKLGTPDASAKCAVDRATPCQTIHRAFILVSAQFPSHLA